MFIAFGMLAIPLKLLLSWFFYDDLDRQAAIALDLLVCFIAVGGNAYHIGLNRARRGL